MQRLQNPFPLFLDSRGNLLDAGYIYVGTPGDDPETSPIQTYWDPELTLEAAQPLRTRGGVIVNNGSPALVFIKENDYSQRVRDADLNQVGYTASASESGAETVSYQPLDADLTAIAALSTTAFGRSLLTLANVGALNSLLNVAASLPLSGGIVTGNIIRQAAGAHLYHTNSALGSGRVFVTVNSAGDPTSANGDIWLKYAP